MKFPPIIQNPLFALLIATVFIVSVDTFLCGRFAHLSGQANDRSLNIYPRITSEERERRESVRVELDDKVSNWMLFGGIAWIVLGVGYLVVCARILSNEAFRPTLILLVVSFISFRAILQSALWSGFWSAQDNFFPWWGIGNFLLLFFFASNPRLQFGSRRSKRSQKKSIPASNISENRSGRPEIWITTIALLGSVIGLFREIIAMFTR